MIGEEEIRDSSANENSNTTRSWLQLRGRRKSAEFAAAQAAKGLGKSDLYSSPSSSVAARENDHPAQRGQRAYAQERNPESPPQTAGTNTESRWPDGPDGEKQPGPREARRSDRWGSTCGRRSC